MNRFQNNLLNDAFSATNLDHVMIVQSESQSVNVVEDGHVVELTDDSITIGTYRTFPYRDLNGNVESPRKLFITYSKLGDFKYSLNDEVKAGDVLCASKPCFELQVGIKLHGIKVNPQQFLKDSNVKQTANSPELSRSDEGHNLCDDTGSTGDSGSDSTTLNERHYGQISTIADSPTYNKRPKWRK